MHLHQFLAVFDLFSISFFAHSATIYLPNEKFLNNKKIIEQTAEPVPNNSNIEQHIEFNEPKVELSTTPGVVLLSNEQHTNRDIHLERNGETERKDIQRIGKYDIVETLSNRVNPDRTNNDLMQRSLEDEFTDKLDSSIESINAELLAKPDNIHLINIQHHREISPQNEERETVFGSIPNQSNLMNHTYNNRSTLWQITDQSDQPIESQNIEILDTKDPIGNDNIFHNTNIINKVAATSTDMLKHSTREYSDLKKNGEMLNRLLKNKPDFDDCEESTTSSSEFKVNIAKTIPEFPISKGLIKDDIKNSKSVIVMESNKKILVTGSSKVNTELVSGENDKNVHNSFNDTTFHTSNSNENNTFSTEVYHNDISKSGQKEFIFEAIQSSERNENDVENEDHEDKGSSLTAHEAHTIATNVMAALIRHNEQEQDLFKQQKQNSSVSEDSKEILSHSVNSSRIITTSDSSEVNHIVLTNKISQSANSDKTDYNESKLIEEKKEQIKEELSLIEKIILGIRCARQDCRDTLIPDSSQRKSKHTRRPVAKNWTIMRMKRFRHMEDSFIPQKVKSIEISENHSLINETAQKSEINGVQPRNENKLQSWMPNLATADISRIVDAFLSCECRITSMQQSLLRQVLSDSTSRQRVIQAIRKIIDNEKTK